MLKTKQKMITKSLSELKTNRVRNNNKRIELNLIRVQNKSVDFNSVKDKMIVELNRKDYKTTMNLVEKLKNFPSFERFKNEDRVLFNKVVNHLHDEIFYFSMLILNDEIECKSTCELIHTLITNLYCKHHSNYDLVDRSEIN